MWAALVAHCSYRALLLRLRQPRAFAAMRAARRQLPPVDAHELLAMAATSPQALENLLAERCAQANDIAQTLFIEVEACDEMNERWAGLGFATEATIDMPWGPTHLIVRPPSSASAARR